MYTALYRKYRPREFDSIVGQEHIVRTLRNQLQKGRVSHAYLFCGTRGTGKTSTAKIFARAVNCETTVDERVNGDACGLCRACRAIDNGYSLNVIEIDAASNNSVDNVRDIREEVKYPPAEGKYKVYIIDEVHMLSPGAFNALLKTLEEPPEFVVFILATTDPQKIPATVHSRMQRFDFRRITAADVSQTLRAYMAAEGVDISGEALDYIARVSDGSMRDALSILDQCTTFYFNQSVGLQDVLDIVGAVDDRVFFELTDALYSMDGSRAMEIIDNLMTLGRDINRFAADFVIHLRNLLVAGGVDGASAALNLSAETIERLKAQAQSVSRAVLINYINTFSELQGQLRYAVNERVVFEVCCLRLCSPKAAPDAPGLPADAQMSARLKKLEDDVRGLKTDSPAAAAPAVTKAPTLKKSVPADIEEVCKSWAEFAASVKRKPLNAYLAATKPTYLDGGALTLISTSLPAAELLKRNEADIKTALAEKYNREFEVRFTTTDEHNDRHRKIYGAEDIEISKEIFTGKLDTDIIFKD